MGRQVHLGDGVLDYLMRYEYPGNIRELENLIEQGVALAVEGEVRLQDVIPPDEESYASRDEPEVKPLQDVVERAEQEAIERALSKVEGNKERAAELLGLSSTTLWRKMKRLNVVYP
jgi:two-component system response regulator HydG